MDVGFLVDSSTSINMAHRLNFQRIKDFIKGFVKTVKVGQNDTRIGVATYSSRNSLKVRFNFTTFFATDSLVDAIQNIPYTSGRTYTGDAISRIWTKLFSVARDGVPKILIILTDGESDDNVTIPSRRLRDEDRVHIISVGVGNILYDELADMASDPDNENIFNVTFFSLFSLVGSLLESVCKGE